MKQHELLDGESILTQSDQNIVTLTNKRVRYESKEFGKAHISEILLENIGSVSAHYSSNVFYLILGSLLMLVGLFFLMSTSNEDDTAIGIGMAIFGLILILLYFSSRKYLLTIYSKGEGKINFEAKGLNMEAVLDFINKIAKAIDQRRKN